MLENQIWFLRVCHHVPFLLYHRIADAIDKVSRKPMSLYSGMIAFYLCLIMESTAHSGRRCCDVIAPVDMTCSRFTQVRCFSLHSHKSNTLLFMQYLVTHKHQFPSRFTALLHESLACWLTDRGINVYGHKHQQYLLTQSSSKYSIGLCTHT